MSDEHTEEDAGGESACFAHLLCSECGVVMDGTTHNQGCTWVDPENRLNVMGNSRADD